MMDVDCMILEDVELEPQLPATSGEGGSSQHLHGATRVKGDWVSANPACMRFQTAARTGTPRAVWLRTAETTASSASRNAERKDSHSFETHSGVRMHCASIYDAGSETRSSASGFRFPRTPACRTHSISVCPSFAPFCFQGRERTGMAARRAGRGAVRNQAHPPPSPSLMRDHVLGFLTFLLCGVASLCCWQFLLSLMPYMESTFFDGIPVGNSLMGVYQVGCICVQLVLMFLVEAMRPWMIIAATAFDAALALLFPLVVTNGSYRTKMALTHMVALLFGASAGVICGSCLAVASALTYNFIGAFSAGQGIAGIVSFVIGLAFKEIYDLGSADGVSRMLWMVYGISCGVSLVSGGLLLVALRQPWAARHLVRYWEAQQLRASTRRWTVMWQRWVGQPQNVGCSQVVAAVSCGAMEVPASGCSHEKGGGCAAANTGQSEDVCADVEFCTASKQQGMESTNRKPTASQSALTTTAAVTSPTPILSGGRGAEKDGSIRGLMPDKQALRSGDSAPDATPSTTTTGTGGSMAASTDLEGRETRHEPSNDSEAVAACWCGGPPEASRNEEGARKPLQENVSKERRGVFRILFRSGDASFCEQASVPAEEEKHQPSRGWRYMLRDSGVYLFCVLFNFFVTLNLYPRVGPIMWHYSSFVQNGPQYIILFGVFCLGDFFGKCLMDISKTTRALSWCMIGKKLLLPVVVSRLGIAVFFLLGAYMNSHWFFNSFALYVVIMLLLAITNGWCATTSLLYVCTSVERLEEREILGPASVLMLQLGIMAGAWSALAYPAS